MRNLGVGTPHHRKGNPLYIWQKKGRGRREWRKKRGRKMRRKRRRKRRRRRRMIRRELGGEGQDGEEEGM